MIKCENLEIYEKKIPYSEIEQVFKLKISQSTKKIFFPLFKNSENCVDRGRFLLFNFINWCFWKGDLTNSSNFEIVGCNHVTCLNLRQMSVSDMYDLLVKETQVKKIKKRKIEDEVNEDVDTIDVYPCDFWPFVNLMLIKNEVGDSINQTLHASVKKPLIINAGMNIITCNRLSTLDMVVFETDIEGVNIFVLNNKMLITSAKKFVLEPNIFFATSLYELNLLNESLKSFKIESMSVKIPEGILTLPSTVETMNNIFSNLLRLMNFYEQSSTKINNYIIFHYVSKNDTSFLSKTSKALNIEDDKQPKIICDRIKDLFIQWKFYSGLHYAYTKPEIEWASAKESSFINVNFLLDTKINNQSDSLFSLIVKPNGLLAENFYKIVECIMMCNCSVEDFFYTNNLGTNYFEGVYQNIVAEKPFGRVVFQYLTSSNIIIFLIKGNLEKIKTAISEIQTENILENLVEITDSKIFFNNGSQE